MPHDPIDELLAELADIADDEYEGRGSPALCKAAHDALVALRAERDGLLENGAGSGIFVRIGRHNIEIPESCAQEVIAELRRLHELSTNGGK